MAKNNLMVMILMSDGSEKNSKGTVLEIQGSYFKVKLEDGTDVPSAQNASSVDVIVGDKVVVSYVDSLHNPIITSVYDKILADVVTTSQLTEILEKFEEKIIERDHPVGSPYFTFLVDDDPNDRFPNTRWVLIEEDTYLVSAGVNRVGASPVGSNTHTLTTAQMPLHTHIQNEHTHRSYYDQSGFTTTIPASVHYLKYSASAVGWTTAALTGQNTAGINMGTTATNQNTGSGEAHNNMPKSIAIYMWRRVN